MGSPAFFGKLATFESATRKPALVAFGLFNAQDNLAFIASVPTSAIFSQASQAFSATAAIDSSAADVLTMVLTANVTSMTVNYGGSSSIPTGQRFYLRIVENSVGGWTCALPTNLNVDQGYAIDTGANRINVLPMRYNGANWEFFSAPFSVPA